MPARCPAVAVAALPLLVACGSHSTGLVSGEQDTHCAGVTPATIAACVTATPEAKPYLHDDASEGFGETLYNGAGDDDECKYHVAWAADDVAKNRDVQFTLTASVLSTKAPMDAAAAPYIEASLDPDHLADVARQRQSSPTAGTFSVGPVRFPSSGRWTVRFHFFGQCADTDGAAGVSPHGHAAFYVQVP